MRKYVMLTLLSVALFMSGITLLAMTHRKQSPSQPKGTKLSEVLHLEQAKSVEVEIEEQLVGDIAIDDQGNTYVAIGGYPGRTFSIKRFAPDGSPLGYVPLRPEVWQSIVNADHLGIGKDGTLYVTVSWLDQAGIVALDQDGKLVSVVTFSDFTPGPIVVDRWNRVWVIGKKYPDQKRNDVAREEELRIYSPNLELLDVPVRHQKAGPMLSPLTRIEDDIIYYARESDTVHLFHEGKLTETLVLPKLAPLEPPGEVAAGLLTSNRVVAGVYKTGGLFLVTGFYLVVENGPGKRILNRTFMALVTRAGDVALPEVESPDDFLPMAYSNGHLVSVRGESSGKFKLAKVPVFHPDTH